MSTLSDYGVTAPEQISLFVPLEDLNPRCTLIKNCDTWDEVRDILEQNKKTHPDDKIWIGFNGCFQVGREKEAKA
jgi:hypothetical protein